MLRCSWMQVDGVGDQLRLLAGEPPRCVRKLQRGHVVGIGDFYDRARRARRATGGRPSASGPDAARRRVNTHDSV